MPSVLNPSGGTTQPGSRAPRGATGARYAEDIGQAGRVTVSISDPAETLKQSAGNIGSGIVGLGKGAVSLVENFPILGVVAKPIIGAVGGVADATIGQVVKAAEGVRVGDKNIAELAGTPFDIVGGALGAGLEALGAPSRFVEQRVAELKIKSSIEGRKDPLNVLFGDAPASAVNAVRGGVPIEEAALNLANSNAGYSENGALNFLYSAILDPLNIILPGVGKGLSAAKQASTLNKIGASTLRAAGRVEDANFAEKWNWVGKIYEGTLGKAGAATRRGASNIVKESALGWTRVHNTKVIGSFLDDIEALGGREIADRGLKNYAATFNNAIKSGSVRARAGIVRSNAQDFADNLITQFIKALKGEETAKLTRDQLLNLPAVDGKTIGAILTKMRVPKESIDEMTQILEDGVSKNIRSDELRRKVIKQRDAVEEAVANARIRRESDLIRETAQYRAEGNARLASEDAVRVLREEKNDRIPSASNPSRGKPELVQDLRAGFGLDGATATKIAENVYSKYGGDIRSIADVLSMARGAAFGQAMKKVAAIRKSMEGDALFSRITITSARSLTDTDAARLVAQADELIAVAEKGGPDAAKATKALKDLIDDVVNKYDELGAMYAGDDYTYTEVIEFLRKAPGITVRALKDEERALISNAKDASMRQLADAERELAEYGYRLGIAPKRGILKVTTMAPDPHGRERFIQMLMPFSDTLDHIAIKGLDDALASEKLRPTGLSRIWEGISRPYGSEITKNVIAERFVTSMVQKTGISVRKARAILAKVSTLAAEKNIQPRALFLDADKVDEIFRFEMKDSFGRLADNNTTPIKEIIDASAGDWSSAGLTSGFTGRVKSVFPVLSVLTDRIYPEIRFGGLNPFFNLVLERIETTIMRLAYGIRKEVARQGLGDIQGTILRKAHLDPRNVNREITDGTMDIMDRAARSTATAVISSPNFSKRVVDKVKDYFTVTGDRSLVSIKKVKDTKRIARDIMTDRLAAREFIDTLESVAPGKLAVLSRHYGVTTADDVVERLLADYLVQSDPILFAQMVKSEGIVARRLATEALRKGGLTSKQATDVAAGTIAAYETALLRASREADKAQYFASHRTWLERSLNHPFLGVYPYSYMVQKAVPSLLRYMFLTPLGKGRIAPGLGFQKFDQVLEWMEHQSNTDADVIKDILKDDAVLYVFSSIFPVTPDAMGFSLPTWLRRGIIQPGLRGTALTPGEFAPTISEVGSTVVRGTVLGQARTLIEGIQGVDDSINANESIGGFIQEQAQSIQEQISGLRNP
jgi:hypothetical protein